MFTRIRTAFLWASFCLIVLWGAPLASMQAVPITITVDTAANRHSISQEIYGVNFASTAQLAELNCPLNRYGGNFTSRYNWKINADNRANDFFFESIGNPSTVPAQVTDAFIAETKAGGAQPMITIPMIGWVAKLGPNQSKLSSFSIQKYGPQTGNDAQFFPDAGNGIKLDGTFVTGNDPNDANVPADTAFQRGWIEHMVNQFGTAANGGLRYYILDNEYGLWHETHRDVHPVGTKMAEGRDRMLEYAAMIKSVDPTAVVVGPEEWGWVGYRLSGFDLQFADKNGYDFSKLPDRNANGGLDHLPWLLGQLQQNKTSTGKRLIDVFSVHFYPQSGEDGDDVSTSMQLLRNRSTRSLWDPNYVDESYIKDNVQLIPRLKNWINTLYPETKIAVTEYSWGADNHINGATAQADVLGIFGREGLDMATRFTVPDSATPTFKAIKLYRNYDGNKSAFGDTSVSASGPNPDMVSTFAGVRSLDGALTVMVVGKFLTESLPATIKLMNFTGKETAQVWQLTAANTINRLADVPITDNQFTTTIPAQSITLFVVAAANQPPTISPIKDQTIKAGDLKVIPVFASDPDGTSSLKFTLVSAPSFVTLTDIGNGIGMVRIAPPGTATQGGRVTVQVTDSGGLSAQTSFNVTVEPTTNTPPVITPISDQTVLVGEVRLVGVSASDQEGSFGLRLSLVSAPAFVTLTDDGGGAGTIRIAPTSAESTAIRVTVQVTDSGGLTAQTSFSVTVLSNVTISNASYTKPVLSIVGTGFGATGAKVNVNGTDVTALVKSQNDTTLTLKGNQKKLNLKKGDNRITVTVNGVTSNTFVLTL